MSQDLSTPEKTHLKQKREQFRVQIRTFQTQNLILSKRIKQLTKDFSNQQNDQNMFNVDQDYLEKLNTFLDSLLDNMQAQQTFQISQFIFNQLDQVKYNEQLVTEYYKNNIHKKIVLMIEYTINLISEQIQHNQQIFHEYSTLFYKLVSVLNNISVFSLNALIDIIKCGILRQFLTKILPFYQILPMTIIEISLFIIATFAGEQSNPQLQQELTNQLLNSQIIEIIKNIIIELQSKYLSKKNNSLEQNTIFNSEEESKFEEKLDQSKQIGNEIQYGEKQQQQQFYKSLDIELEENNTQKKKESFNSENNLFTTMQDNITRLLRNIACATKNDYALQLSFFKLLFENDFIDLSDSNLSDDILENTLVFAEIMTSSFSQALYESDDSGNYPDSLAFIDIKPLFLQQICTLVESKRPTSIKILCGEILSNITSQEEIGHLLDGFGIQEAVLSMITSDCSDLISLGIYIFKNILSEIFNDDDGQILSQLIENGTHPIKYFIEISSVMRRSNDRNILHQGFDLFEVAITLCTEKVVVQILESCKFFDILLQNLFFDNNGEILQSALNCLDSLFEFEQFYERKEHQEIFLDMNVDLESTQQQDLQLLKNYLITQNLQQKLEEIVTKNQNQQIQWLAEKILNLTSLN